jgi:hypothetical protein
MDRVAPCFFVAYETTRPASETAVTKTLERLKATRILANLYRIPTDGETLYGIALQLQSGVHLDTLRFVIFDIDGSKSFYFHHPRE